MERNFNNEFERFLKENADQYRLYPSSKVWNGIYSALHARRKWFGLGVILLLITGSLVTLLITHSSKETFIQAGKAVVSNQHVQQVAPLIPEKEQQQQPIARTQKTKSQDLVAISSFVSPAVSMNPFGKDLAFDRTDLSLRDNMTQLHPLDIGITDELTDQDLFPPAQKRDLGQLSTSSGNQNPLNWTIESVINSFSRKHRNLSWQLNVTPTISYRKLSANRSFLVSASNAPSTYAPLYDINSVVTHKPDLGLEFGLTSKYAITKNFRAKAGLQFNINGYDIKAFNSSYEIAKIDLRGSRGVDSFYAFSTHRNFNGYKSDWLHNFYFEISLPVGLEVNIVGDDKVQFGVAGTIQPTYVIGDRAYLLSSDYKNYAEVPWLIRRWNVNTGLETFVAYSTGKVKWQVGPQVRYQILSSFIDQYPVKENLFDFGLKVGVSLTR